MGLNVFHPIIPY